MVNEPATEPAKEPANIPNGQSGQTAPSILPDLDADLITYVGKGIPEETVKRAQNGVQKAAKVKEPSTHGKRRSAR